MYFVKLFSLIFFCKYNNKTFSLEWSQENLNLYLIVMTDEGFGIKQISNKKITTLVHRHGYTEIVLMEIVCSFDLSVGLA